MTGIDPNAVAAAFATIMEAGTARPALDGATAEVINRLERIERRLTSGTALLWSLDKTREQLGGVGETYVRELADAGLIERRYQGRRPFFVADSVRAYVDTLSDA